MQKITMRPPWPKLVLEHQRVLSIVFVLVTLACLIAAFRVRFDFNFQEYFPERDATRVAYREQLNAFPSEWSEFIVVVADTNLFSQKGIKDLTSLQTQIEQSAWAQHVVGPFNLQPELFGRYRQVYERATAGGVFAENVYSLLRDVVTTNPLVANQLAFANGDVLLLRITLKPEFADDTGREIVRDEIDSLVQQFETTFQRVYYSGFSAIRADYANALKREQRTFFPITVLVLLLALAACVGRSWVILLPFLCSAFAVVWTIALMSIQGDAFTILSSATPVLILVLGISDSLHVFAHLGQAHELGLVKDEAIIWSFERVGRACFLTSITTAVGFAAFNLTDIPVLTNFGYYTAVGVLFNFVSIMILLPILIRRMPQPSRALVPVNSVRTVIEKGTSLLLALPKKPTPTLVASIITALVLLAGVSRLREETSVYQGLSSRAELREKVLRSESDLGGLLPFGVTFWAEPEDLTSGEMLAAVDTVQSYLLRQDHVVGSAISVVNVVKALELAQGRQADWSKIRPDGLRSRLASLTDEYPQTLGSILNLDANRLLIKSRLKDVGSVSFRAFLNQLTEFINQHAGSVQWQVAGLPNLSLRLSELVVRYILLTFLATFVLIFAGFVYWFRGLGMAVVGIIPNLIPLVAVLGFLGWMDIPLQPAVVVVFSVVFGIAVNDTIHFLSRYARERSKNQESALSTTIRQTATPIMLSSAVLISGFFILVFSEFLGLSYLGLLLSVGIVAALFGDLIVLPVLLSRLGR